MTKIDELTGLIIEEAVRIHRGLGPGLLESVYRVVLARRLERRGVRVEMHKAVQFEFDGIAFDNGFRADLLVEGLVVVELKSVETLARVHMKQVLTYLRLLDLPVGLLLNFGAATLKDGLRRVVNNLPPSSSPLLRINRPPPILRAPAAPRDT